MYLNKLKYINQLSTLILLVSVGFVQFGGGNHVVNFYPRLNKYYMALIQWHISVGSNDLILISSSYSV